MNRILFSESEWMSSQLSIVRWTGACRIDGFVYQLDRRTGFLVRQDFRRYVKGLGVDFLKKIEKRHGAGRKSKRILSRMSHIVYVQKTLQERNETPTIKF